MINKLIIGSANFGLKYGVANNKRLTKKDIFEILRYAKKLGVFGIDTAKGYGNAEEIVGDYLKLQREKSFKIITKILHKDYKGVQSVKDEVRDSLKKLNVKCIDFLLLHSFETYQEYKDTAITAFEELIKEGYILHWGVSVYYPEEARQVILDGFSNFAVEFPLNIFDRRFLKRDFLKGLKKKKCFLFARSIFLQGLFFLSEKGLTGNFETVKENVLQLNALSQRFKIPLSDILLLFAAANPYIDGIIIGVDSKEQLKKNLGFYKNLKKYQMMKHLLDKLEVNDERILLPYLWR
ncbi:MAG TPA: aldo/keto reductase [Candidatus Omnitrophica bacterium]|nr:aldo/keto reductase [Candidatus Omnitrophota bacterium]